MRKWINRFGPIYKAGVHVKIQDLPLGSIVETTGVMSSDNYEEVVYEGIKGPVTGWIHTDDLEEYVRNYPVDCVVIENQTPDPKDFKQYMMHKGVKQVNMCGELSACYILGISLGTMLEHWEKKVPAFYKRIFGAGRARGTGAEELGEMMTQFGRECTPLTIALKQAHIGRARYTIKALNQLMEKGGVIVSVHIDAVTGLLRGSGVLHWVTLIDVKSERNGQGMVGYYNPAMNCVETCSWNEFILSAGQVYGMFAKN